MLFGNVTCFSVNKENKFANDTNLCNYFSYSHLHIITTFYFLTVFFFRKTAVHLLSSYCEIFGRKGHSLSALTFDNKTK